MQEKPAPTSYERSCRSTEREEPSTRLKGLNAQEFGRHHSQNVREGRQRESFRHGPCGAAGREGWKDEYGRQSTTKTINGAVTASVRSRKWDSATQSPARLSLLRRQCTDTRGADWKKAATRRTAPTAGSSVSPRHLPARGCGYSCGCGLPSKLPNKLPSNPFQPHVTIIALAKQPPDQYHFMVNVIFYGLSFIG